MNDKHKTKQQLVKELARLRRQITKPGKPVAGKKQKSRESGRSFLNPIVLFRDITLQKKTEKNLIDSENFLKSIFASIPDGISILNEKMEIVGVNPAMEKWYSHAMPLVGKKCYQAYHGRTKACDICPSLQTLRTGKPSYEVVPKTGKQKKILGWQDLYSFPWYDSKTGNLNGVIEYVRDVTERKRAEEEIEKFKFISDNSADAHFLVDRDAKFQYVNKSACKMFGYSEQELLARSVLDLDVVYDLKKYQDLFDLIQQRTIQPIETINKRKDGSVFPVELTVTGYKIGGRLYMFAALRDVTERKRAEEALSKSEEKFRALFESAKDGILQLSSNGDVVALNESFARMHGWTVEEMLKMNITDLDTPESTALAPVRFQRLFAGESIVFEVEHYCKNGQTIPIEVTASLVTIRGEKHIFGFHREITERKKAEEALRASEEKFKALSEQSIAGTCLIQDEKFVYVNPRLAEILGFKQEAMTGLTVLDLVAETDREIVRENLHKRLSGEVPSIHYTFRALHKNGSEVEMEVHGSSIMYQGRLAVIATVLDITERKRAENALKDAKNEIEQWSRELEDRVNKKTAELEKSRAQLIQSEKLSAMGRLSAGLAHELNSPLAGLLPLIDKYKNREKEGTNEFREMTLMLTACEHMARIVRDFSAFSRRPAEERARLNINDVMESTLSFTVDSIEKKGIKMVRQHGEALPDILGNKTELQQVLINLLINARDSMPDGGQITLKTRISPDKENIILEIIDTGRGIDKENLNKIFDPFFTTKSIAEGTGLGLTVSYGIIKNHGGDISAESEPGKGARFIISLPAIKYHESKDTNN